MNPLQMALKKFGRRYSGAGRESFTLSRPLTEKSYGGVEVIKQPGSDMDRAANMPQGVNKGFREREKAIEGNPFGGVGDMLTKVFGGPGSFGDDPLHKGQNASQKYGTQPPTDDPAYTGPRTSDDGDMEMARRLMTTGEGAAPAIGKRSVAERLRDEIVRRESKDFSKGGKDYDKDHDWKDALRSAGLSALQAIASGDPNASIGQQLGRGLGGAVGGGVAGAFDRNADEKIGNQMVLDREYPKWAKAFERESAEKNQALGEADKIGRIEDRERDNTRMEADLERKVRRDSVLEQRDMAAIEKGRAQILSNERLLELREKTAASNDANAKRRLELIEKEMENRNIRAEADRSSREKIAGMREAGSTRRAELQTEARRALAEYNAAVKSGQQDKAIAARERLVQLKAQADAEPQ